MDYSSLFEKIEIIIEETRDRLQSIGLGDRKLRIYMDRFRDVSGGLRLHLRCLEELGCPVGPNFERDNEIYNDNPDSRNHYNGLIRHIHELKTMALDEVGNSPG